ncbi:MAG TPA: FecR domain-containing protein [Polyangiaceae bacterium]|nr:FecR domain-containing protein [Polyangiaceae bacterium]
MDKQVAEKLVPALSAERVERQWRAIAARTERGRGGLAPWHYGAALVAAAILLLVFGLSRGTPGPVAGQTFNNGAAAPATLQLVDGSQLQVSPSGRVEFGALSSQAVELTLAHGTVELEVTHVAGRRFVVRAGDVDVIVRGTHFRVELSDAEPRVVSVSVQRGRVEVRQRSRQDAEPLLLDAGMSWTMGQSSAPTPEAAASATEPAPARAERTAPEPAGSVPAASEPIHAESPSAKQLFEQADQARLGGHPRDAANLLDQFRRRFPGDARAGLAALQLGRLRLDSLNDAAGALEAFRDAARSSAPAIQEDALARQAQALEALGNRAGCARVRELYLSRYPSGIHSASIAKRCSGKQ